MIRPLHLVLFLSLCVVVTRLTCQNEDTLILLLQDSQPVS